MSLDAFRLDGTVAVVTGACGKLGPIWVDALLGAGARVGAFELPGAPESAAYQQLKSAGDRLRRFDCDVTSRESIEQAVAAVAAAFGEPSVLVNNAGIRSEEHTSELQSH